MKVTRLSRILLFVALFGGLSASVALGAVQEEAEHDAAAAAPAKSGLALLGAALGAGMVVIGAGVGIGRFAAAAAESTARQPEAAADIRAAVNLPLFLLEGAAIIGLVVCLLIVLL